VVLPSFNRNKKLHEAISSVLALSEVAFELIVVDDGSTDGTYAELMRLDDERVTVVGLRSSQGANVARNLGIAHARAPIIAFLDSDDLYLPGRLEQPLSLMRRNPHIGIVLSSFTTEKGPKRTILEMPQRFYSGNELLRLTARHILAPTTSGLTIRRDVLEMVGGFDPSLKRMQDRDLVMRVAGHTMGATIATPLWHKRWQVDGISSSQATYIPALIELIERHEIFQDEELAFRDYLIARHLVAQARAIRLRRLWRDYAKVRRLVVPRPPRLPRLIAKYLGCHRERRRLQRQLLSGELGAGMGSPQHVSASL
jgi:glycosyltransferase involved in cell wall biosynthesis